MQNKSLEKKSRFATLRTPIIMTGIFWAIAVVVWQLSGQWFYIVNFGYIGTSIGVGMGWYAMLPKNKKYKGRRLSQLLVGIYMLGFLGFIARENMQIEGFFFYLLTGLFAGAVLHYFIAKLVGPLVFNRAWCSWACWTAMVLDFLPFERNRSGRLATRWGNIRYAHFAISLGLVLVFWFVVGYRVESFSITELYWLAGGNVLYYASAVALAFGLKDNRAFCKYVCPITTFLKTGSRLALWKISGDASKCNMCGACEKICPMDVRITDYVKAGTRVLSTECIMCLRCENVCAQKALTANWRFDCGTRELLTMSTRQDSHVSRVKS